MDNKMTEPGFDDAANERLTDLGLVDALETMARRCFGLEAAIGSLTPGGGR
jgi:hypothetical protein